MLFLLLYAPRTLSFQVAFTAPWVSFARFQSFLPRAADSEGRDLRERAGSGAGQSDIYIPMIPLGTRRRAAAAA